MTSLPTLPRGRSKKSRTNSFSEFFFVFLSFQKKTTPAELSGTCHKQNIVFNPPQSSWLWRGRGNFYSSPDTHLALPPPCRRRRPGWPAWWPRTGCPSHPKNKNKNRKKSAEVKLLKLRAAPLLLLLLGAAWTSERHTRRAHRKDEFHSASIFSATSPALSPSPLSPLSLSARRTTLVKHWLASWQLWFNMELGSARQLFDIQTRRFQGGPFSA